MTPTMDLVVPTYNRPHLLTKVLRSLLVASTPFGLRTRVIVVDNNSRADLAESNKNAVLSSGLPDVRYVIETNQGRSWALNRGIRESDAEFVGFLDDDEEVDGAWLCIAAEHILKGSVDFVGGPYKPNWEQPPPQWLPALCGKYAGVVGWIEQSAVVRSYADFQGTLCGGNCIVRRTALIEVGGYSTSLGRTAKTLMGGEDEEMQRSLVARGYTGVYDPRLIIYHLIPTVRMTRRYHISWAFWSGVSNGLRLRWEAGEGVPTIVGVPRYRFALALRGLAGFVRPWTGGDPFHRAVRFAGAMDASYLLGLIHGRHFIRLSSAR